MKNPTDKQVIIATVLLFCLFLFLTLLFIPTGSMAGWRPQLRDRTPPSVPSGITATPASTSQIDLSWKASTDNVRVMGYRIYRDGYVAGTGASTAFSDKNLSPGRSYSYQIVAIDSSYNVSQKSAAVIAKTDSSTPPPTGETRIGHIGCSMTMGAIQGVKAIGSGSLVWSGEPVYGGGGFALWAENLTDTNKYWAEFSKAVKAEPVTKIWFELCALGSKTASETLDNAIKVIDEVKRRIPGVEVYVSAQPDYLPSDHECAIAGSQGPERMAEIAKQLIANNKAKAGPVMGPLSYPDRTLTDGCHGNDQGNDMMGQQFIDFFMNIKPAPVAGVASGLYVVDDGRAEFATALAHKMVDGALVRVQWAQLNPKENIYDFTKLCDKITQAHNLGKKVSIVNYTLPPAWLLAKVPTSEQWTLQMGRAVTTIKPWNTVLLAAMQQLAYNEANAPCGGVMIKNHPAVAQIDTGVAGALSIRDKPEGALQADIESAVLQSIETWRGAYAVDNDPKAYYISAFPYRDKTVDAAAIVKEVLKEWPDQHIMVENWGVAGVGDTTLLKLAQHTIIQACGYFSTNLIKCSDTGRTDNTPQNAYEKILAPLGNVRSIQLYPADVIYAAYASQIEYLHGMVNPK